MSVWTWSPARRRRFAIAWAVALVAGGACFALAGAGYARLPRPQPLEELSYYPSGRWLEPMALGHAETAADLAWLRAVQYYGAHRLKDNQFGRLPHVFDVLTSLAPRFLAAYGFGAFALGQEGRSFDDGVRLMEKGLEANPTSGRLAFELGFLYFVRPGGRDLPHAYEYFAQAARQADAPPQAARFAAFAGQNAGDLSLAFELWAEVARTTPNRYLKEMALKNMERIRGALATGREELAVRKLATPRVLLVPSERPAQDANRAQDSTRAVR